MNDKRSQVMQSMVFEMSAHGNILHQRSTSCDTMRRLRAVTYDALRTVYYYYYYYYTYEY